MDSGQIVLDDEKIYKLAEELGIISKSAEDDRDSFSNDYQSLVSNNMLTNSVNSYTSGMDNIAFSSDLTKKTVLKMLEQFDLDRKASEKISDIKIPNIYEAEDSIKENNFEEFMLSKIDGKSVNEGYETSDKKELDETSVIEKEELKNVSGGLVKEESYDDNYSGELSKISNISNNSDIQIKEYDSSSIIDDTTLKEMDTNEQVLEEYDDSSIINKTNLDNINNNYELEDMGDYNDIES